MFESVNYEVWALCLSIELWAYELLWFLQFRSTQIDMTWHVIIIMPSLKSSEIELACFDDNTIRIKGQISMSHKFPLQIIILALNVPTNLYQYHYHKLVTINIHIT